MYALKQRKQLFPFVKKSREDEWTFEPTTKVCLLLSRLGELGLLSPSFPSLAQSHNLGTSWIHAGILLFDAITYLICTQHFNISVATWYFYWLGLEKYIRFYNPEFFHGRHPTFFLIYLANPQLFFRVTLPYFFIGLDTNPCFQSWLQIKWLIANVQ